MTGDRVTDPCTPPTNPIACENSRLGNPEAEWLDIGPDAGDPSIQGFTTDISVNRGDTVRFKINTDSTNYHLDIYRVGYYAGCGARKVATVLPSASLPQIQPDSLQDPSTQLIDCGNWAESASWAVPSDATSGVYVAKLVRDDAAGASHVIFIVRDDAGGSDILFQTSDTTWQAYNSYGGSSLYDGYPPVGRAYKVSFNRPFATRGNERGRYSWFFVSEYPMVRWLEANGYDVSYCTGVDTDRMGTRLLSHRVFLSVGHDEYWSANQRANVEAARAAGVNLAFFSGNEMFWKIRWEPSVDGSGTPYRTMVCYKESGGGRLDPDAAWTGTWRDPSFSPPFDGGRPENALIGTIFMVNFQAFDPLIVPSADGKMRFWRNTSIANLPDGESAILGCGCDCTLGFEWDEDLDNGFRPPGLIRASSTTATVGTYLLDHGFTFGVREATHHLTLYRHPPTLRGALVFGAGTINWSWGLDDRHENPFDLPPSVPELAMQQATVNLLADMCDPTGQRSVQPRTLQPGLVLATASTDSTPPTSLITSPSSGGTVVMGSVVSITGTAVDLGGVVGGVEVSVDGGLTWHPAIGRANWSYSWKPTLLGSMTLKSRAVDDSGNLENAGSGINVTVVPRSRQILLFYNATEGNNAIGRLNDTGNYVNLSTRTFAAGWTHIVTGINNVLFFYRAGYAWTGILDDDGNYRDVGEVGNSSSAAWTHIVAGADNIFLFYDSISGSTMIGRLDDHNYFVGLCTLGFCPGWTSIVRGVNNVLFFYNKNTGRAATGRLGVPAGSYVDLREITGVSTGWTHIVPGVNNVLLFFNADTGSAMTGRLGDAGSFTYLRNPLFESDLGWTNIAAGVRNTILLFYHAPSALGATGRLDADGNYVHLMNDTGFSPGWTHIIDP